MNKEKQATLQARIIERYASIIDDVQNFSKTINRPLKQSFRINSLKGDKDTVLTNLREYDETIKATDWYKNGFITKLENLGSSIEHFTGQIYIQELTSMMPALVVPNINESKKIIDCCASIFFNDSF